MHKNLDVSVLFALSFSDLEVCGDDQVLIALTGTGEPFKKGYQRQQWI